MTVTFLHLYLQSSLPLDGILLKQKRKKNKERMKGKEGGNTGTEERQSQRERKTKTLLPAVFQTLLSLQDCSEFLKVLKALPFIHVADHSEDLCRAEREVFCVGSSHLCPFSNLSGIPSLLSTFTLRGQLHSLSPPRPSLTLSGTVLGYE